MINRRQVLLAVLIVITVGLVAFAMVYRDEQENLASVRRAQEWAGQSSVAPSEPVVYPPPQTDPYSSENHCTEPAQEGQYFILKDGMKFCLVVSYDPSSQNASDHIVQKITTDFIFTNKDGSAPIKIKSRVEGYQWNADIGYSALPDVPFASHWQVAGWSDDGKTVYFTRSQGLPLDGPKTGVALDLWSLTIAAGELKQVLKVGDLKNYWTSAYILDVNIPSQRVIVRKDDDVWVENFAGKTIVKLPAIPFDLKKAEAMTDEDVYVFNDAKGSEIGVNAQREVPYGSGNIIQYGPAWFNIATGKYTFLP